MNNLPDNVPNNFPDSEMLSDEVWEEACAIFNTLNPDQDQLEMAVRILEDEAFANLMREEHADYE